MMMESHLTNAELAILSLVAERDRYGYEIEQVLEARGMRTWTEVGFSSIYYLLKKLERKGLVIGTRQAGSGPGKARVVYHVLPPGRTALKHGVQAALSTVAQAPPPFLLGLANLALLSKQEILAALDRYETGLDEWEQGLLETGKRTSPAPYFVQAMFDYSLTLLRAEKGWLRRFRVILEDSHGKN